MHRAVRGTGDQCRMNEMTLTILPTPPGRSFEQPVVSGHTTSLAAAPREQPPRPHHVLPSRFDLGSNIELPLGVPTCSIRRIAIPRHYPVPLLAAYFFLTYAQRSMMSSPPPFHSDDWD